MPSFRTKRGRCHLDDGRLRLESSLRGQFRRYREGNRLLFYTAVAGVLASIGFVVGKLLAGDLRTLLLVGVIAVLVAGIARASNYLRGFTTADDIPLAAIEYVRPVRGTKGLTRPRFVVAYTVDGDTRRRYVMMPSLWLSYGEAEFRRATETFRDAGLTIRED